MSRRLFALCCLSVMLAGRYAGAASARQSGGAGDLLVSAAASLTDALGDIARAYEQETRTHVALNFGASSSLARQIVGGAPVDLFLSADEAQMDAVASSSQIDAATRV